MQNQIQQELFPEYMQNLVFYNTNGSRAQSEIQEAANATLQAAMAGTEYLLRSKLNMSLKDLGFKAYKL